MDLLDSWAFKNNEHMRKYFILIITIFFFWSLFEIFGQFYKIVFRI